MLAGACQGFLFGNVRTSSAQLAGCHARRNRGTRVQAKSEARSNLRRTIARQPELGTERQNSRCYSSMTGSLLRKQHFFKRVLQTVSSDQPRSDWHLPGEIVSAAENIYREVGGTYLRQFTRLQRADPGRSITSCNQATTWAE